jgi:hypothetical protein
MYSKSNGMDRNFVDFFSLSVIPSAIQISCSILECVEIIFPITSFS